MIFVERFTGWNPDADELNAPEGALLRADNTVMEQQGVVALRPGSAKINSPAYADLDVHSLHTIVRSGTKGRYAGAGSKVYFNHAALSPTFAGSGDISFGQAFGQVFMARGTSKHKHDGTTVRNWGVAMTGATPTTAVIAPDSKTLSTCDQAESPAMTLVPGEGSLAFVADRNSAPTASAQMTPDSGTGRVAIEKDFGIATDFSVYTGGQEGTDDDLLDFYVFLTEPEYLKKLRLMIDVNDGSFQEDFYYFDIEPETTIVTTREPDEILADRLDIQSPDRRRIREEMALNRPIVQITRVDKPVGNVGWNHFQVARGKLSRHGQTAGKNWSTVRKIRVVLNSIVGGAGSEVRIDAIRLIGGHQSPLTGKYSYKYVYVFNEGDYQAKSAPSAASTELEASARGITVTVPVDAGHDTQINAIWVYRIGGFTGQYYRVGVVDSGHPDWAGWTDPDPGMQTPINFADTLADVDAILANLPLETGNAVPPDNIIGIAGLYYDRLFVLADGFLYPSQRLNPESFDPLNSIRVADDGETAYFVASAFGGLYVGTSRDVYRIDGDGAELGGLLNFYKTPLNIGNPPISAAFAQEGNSLAYLAEDGWRILTAGDARLMYSNLLYQGQARHGVSAVNVTGGRFRAAIAKGIFSAITPEGASTTKSKQLHRWDTKRAALYRHGYPNNFRSIHQEPDGTLIAGDDSGFVWQLDTGTQDDGADISPTVWTPFLGRDTRKDPWHARIKAEAPGSGIFGWALDYHLDGSAAPAASLNFPLTAGIQNFETDISAYGEFRQIQARMSGATAKLRLFSIQYDFRELPTKTKFWEPKPKDPSPSRRRFGGVSILGKGVANVTVVVDDVDIATVAINKTDVQLAPVGINAQVGFDIWPKLVSSTGFEAYDWTPTVLEKFPVQTKGLYPATNAEHLGVKEIGGMDFEICTLGALVTFTPYFDGVADATRNFDIQTLANHLETVQREFATPVLAEDVAFSTNLPVEVKTFAPKVLRQFPRRTRYWEQRPSKPCSNRNRFDGGFFTVNTEGNTVTVTPVLDGVDQPTLTLNTSDFVCKKLTFDTLVGYDLWFRLTGASGFLVIEVKPSVVEQFPPTARGRFPNTDMGSGREKEIAGYRMRLCTFGATITVTPVFDNVADASRNFTVISTTDEPVEITSKFATVKNAFQAGFSTNGNVEVYSWEPIVTHQFPQETRLWENRPEQPSPQRRRYSGGTIVADTKGGPVTATAILDGVAQSPTYSLTTSSPVPQKIVFASPIVGRDLWFRLSGAASFRPYGAQGDVLEDLPVQVSGLLPRESLQDGVKGVNGAEIRVCTLGVARVFTLYLDGVAQPETLSITTGDSDPKTDTLNLPSIREGVDVQLHVDGAVELYSWTPKVVYALPSPRKVWDTGWQENQFDQKLWVDEIRVKARTPGDLKVTPYFDDEQFMAQTISVSTEEQNRVKVYRLALPREFVGTVPRFVVQEASGAEFHPFWIEFYYRGTGRIRGKTPRRVRIAA